MGISAVHRLPAAGCNYSLQLQQQVYTWSPDHRSLPLSAAPANSLRDPHPSLYNDSDPLVLQQFVEIYLIIIVYLYWPGSFLKVLYFSAISNIRLLAFIFCIRPVSSIFHRSVYITFIIAGKSRSGNYVCIASVVALL